VGSEFHPEPQVGSEFNPGPQVGLEFHPEPREYLGFNIDEPQVDLDDPFDKMKSCFVRLYKLDIPAITRLAARTVEKSECIGHSNDINLNYSSSTRDEAVTDFNSIVDHMVYEEKEDDFVGIRLMKSLPYGDDTIVKKLFSGLSVLDKNENSLSMEYFDHEKIIFESSDGGFAGEIVEHGSQRDVVISNLMNAPSNKDTNVHDRPLVISSTFQAVVEQQLEDVRQRTPSISGVKTSHQLLKSIIPVDHILSDEESSNHQIHSIESTNVSVSLRCETSVDDNIISVSSDSENDATEEVTSAIAGSKRKRFGGTYRSGKTLRISGSNLSSLSFRCHVCKKIILCIDNSSATILAHYIEHGITNVDIVKKRLSDGRVDYNIVQLPVDCDLGASKITGAISESTVQVQPEFFEDVIVISDDCSTMQPSISNAISSNASNSQYDGPICEGSLRHETLNMRVTTPVLPEVPSTLPKQVVRTSDCIQSEPIQQCFKTINSGHKADSSDVVIIPDDPAIIQESSSNFQPNKVYNTLHPNAIAKLVGTNDNQLREAPIHTNSCLKISSTATRLLHSDSIQNSSRELHSKDCQRVNSDNDCQTMSSVKYSSFVPSTNNVVVILDDAEPSHCANNFDRQYTEHVSAERNTTIQHTLHDRRYSNQSMVFDPNLPYSYDVNSPRQSLMHVLAANMPVRGLINVAKDYNSAATIPLIPQVSFSNISLSSDRTNESCVLSNGSNGNVVLNYANLVSPSPNSQLHSLSVFQSNPTVYTNLEAFRVQQNYGQNRREDNHLLAGLPFKHTRNANEILINTPHTLYRTDENLHNQQYRVSTNVVSSQSASCSQPWQQAEPTADVLIWTPNEPETSLGRDRNIRPRNHVSNGTSIFTHDSDRVSSDTTVRTSISVNISSSNTNTMLDSNYDSDVDCVEVIEVPSNTSLVNGQVAGVTPNLIDLSFDCEQNPQQCTQLSSMRELSSTREQMDMRTLPIGPLRQQTITVSTWDSGARNVVPSQLIAYAEHSGHQSARQRPFEITSDVICLD